MLLTNSNYAEFVVMWLWFKIILWPTSDLKGHWTSITSSPPHFLKKKWFFFFIPLKEFALVMTNDLYLLLVKLTFEELGGIFLAFVVNFNNYTIK